MSLLSSLFVSSLLLYVVLASVRDSVTVREESKKLSIPEIKKTLNKAHLENHGYRKKVTQETSKDSRGRLRYSKITSFTHKRVPCSKALQIVNEAKSMLLKYTENPMTGKRLSEMVEGLRKEMGSQKTYRRRLCTITLDLKTTRPSPSGNIRPKRSAWFGGGGSSEKSGGSSESKSEGSFSVSCKAEASGSWSWG
ncbi:uncharacterized protein [Acropora muricata]|uniref:uncharacterized protein isoform X2 n=1 Tax=Acropora muricata TaxID=159855 RepID=UPI0034E3C843